MTRPKLRVERLLTPAETALVFGVGSKCVVRWEAEGKIRAVRTLGNHRRFAVAEVRGLLIAGGTSEADADARLAEVLR